MREMIWGVLEYPEWRRLNDRLGETKLNSTWNVQTVHASADIEFEIQVLLAFNVIQDLQVTNH
jgi:hypothetical protein